MKELVHPSASKSFAGPSEDDPVTNGGSALTWEQAVLWLRAQPAHADLVKACFFDDPLVDAAERFYLSTEWRAVRRLLHPAGGKALDIGAGRGISSIALARDGWDTTALEPDPSDVVGAGAIRKLAADTHTSIEIVETWGEDLPFLDCSFDLVYVRQALHHARNLRRLCREISRVLKPGGRFLATREHVLSREEDLKVFLANHPLHHLYGGENAYLLDQYLGALQDAGIRLTKVLNPLQTDINVYPETLQSMKARIARKLGFPSGFLFIPDLALSWWGRKINTPGRAYSFLGRKERGQA